MIALYGAAGTDAESISMFAGTVDEALRWADEQECEVNFDVVRFVITRLQSAKKAEGCETNK